MAKYECNLKGDFFEILNSIDKAVLSGSFTANLEDGSDYRTGDVICAVRVYERYSMMGGNRVSMNITLLNAGGNVFLTAITSGGSQAVMFKINTFGEESFLDTISDAVQRYIY